MVIDDPAEVEAPLVLNWHQFDEFSHGLIRVRMCFHLVLLKLVIFYISKFLLDGFGKAVDVRLAIDHQFHEIGRVFAVVEVEEHLSEVGAGEGFLVAG